MVEEVGEVCATEIFPEKKFVIRAYLCLCENCGRNSAPSNHNTFVCPVPECGNLFCVGCVIYDPSGPGDYVICPHCRTCLYLPTR